MTKVMFLPLNYGDVNQNGVRDAFQQAGCTVNQFDYFAVYLHRKNLKSTRQKMIEEATVFKPDLIHMQIQHTSVIDPATISTIKKRLPNVVVSNWTGDVRSAVPLTYMRMAKVADYNLISSTGQLELFKKRTGRDPLYWQIGYNPKLYYQSNNPQRNYEFDAVFIGHHNKKEKYPGAPQRINACRLLRKNFGKRFGLYGHNWPRDVKSKGSIDQKRVAEFYHKGLCSISISHFNDLNHYFSDRLLMCLASGRPTVSLRFPGWQSYFTDMADIVIADSVEDIPRKVNMLKSKPDLAEFIGQQGAAKALAEHTYYSRVVELLEMLKLR